MADSKAKRKRSRRFPILQGRSKELTLAFLALFYFVIATNTQTGWLFVLSAFLLGLLLLAGLRSRGRAAQVELQQSWLTDPLKGRPFRVALRLKNLGPKTLREVRVEAPPPSWALETEGFAWAIPLLLPGQVAEAECLWTPAKRGEHFLSSCRVVCGAPFGLFVSEKQFESARSFLVYPELERLTAAQSRTLSGLASGGSSTSRGLGESYNLRSVRDYRPGDDLRHVHWKATAKGGPGAALQVREHHAPSPLRSSVVLDTSLSQEDDDLFERAVTLTASLLWSAHKQGLSTELVLRSSKGSWSHHRHWAEQYGALAKVQRETALSYADWCEEAESLAAGRRRFSPVLIKACEGSIESWPSWTRSVFLTVSQELQNPSWPVSVSVTQVASHV